MGEIISGVAVEVLKKLGSRAYQEIALACGLKGNVKRLQESMRIISAFLMDAENKQVENKSITEWLQQLKDAFDDATDILDEIEYQAKRNEVVKMYGSLTKKVSSFFSPSNPLAFRLKMAHKIEDIKQRIDEITINGRNLGLVEQHANSKPLKKNLSWRETGSFAPPRVSGRDEEKEHIISLLIRPPKPESQVSNLDVIPIVGIGGLGKTTLAQMVCNDNKIKEHFGKVMWVCVSDEFDVKGLILKIIQAADGTERGVDRNSALNDLQSLLRNKLQGKRFLLVLDDVWNKNAKKWDDLRNNLLAASSEMESNGSKIIVTTRNHHVASIMGTGLQINLEALPMEECWELFVKCAFQAKKEVEKYPRLKEIGMEIVGKCKGLPLALTTLGCLLKSKLHDENEWKKVRDSELWAIDQTDDGILPALRLSYNHLPPEVKQYFSYCSIFPKDFEYRYNQLIMYWMAHGLLQPTNEKEEPEYLGELHIKELVSASLLQIERTHENFGRDFYADLMGRKSFKMHDLVHDLAISTMKSEQVNGQLRTLFIPKSGDEIHSPFPSKLNKIRTIQRWPQLGGTEAVSELSFQWISKEFKYIRVLDLQVLAIRSLPNDFFARMKHLRHLELYNCYVLKKLPDSICKLQLLQSLMLRGCWLLQELPKNMRNLVSLRNLYITVQVTSLSSIDIGCFKFLQSLVTADCFNLVSLPRDMGRLTTLKQLMISGCAELASFENEDEERKQNEVVKDSSLQSFGIEGSPKLTALPNWLERSTKTLQRMMIDRTGLTSMPEWLPNLATLDTLYIKDCPELSYLPNGMDHLHSLQYLYILDCPRLVPRCTKDAGPDWTKIAHVPHLKLGKESSEEEEA